MWYAIGEILLVVIGILIAFQIDNWNEERLFRKQEVKILTQIRSDLNTNIVEIEKLQAKVAIAEQASDSLIKSFRVKKTVVGFPNFVAVLHQRFSFSEATSGYAQLRGSLGTLIRNDWLRNKLVQLYEVEIQEITNREETIANHIDQNLSPLSNTLFEIDISLQFKLDAFGEVPLSFYDPINIDQLLVNTEYANTIIIQKRLVEAYSNILSSTREELISMVQLLDEEIDRF